MSIFDKIYGIFNKDDDCLCLDKPEKKLAKTSEYFISPYEAFKIAEKKYNLKTDFFRIADGYISYLDFTDCNVELVDGDNGKKYWLVKITESKFSSINSSEDDFSTTFSDGYINKNDLKKLQCLIDVNTGEYIYYPEL